MLQIIQFSLNYSKFFSHHLIGRPLCFMPSLIKLLRGFMVHSFGAVGYAYV